MTGGASGAAGVTTRGMTSPAVLMTGGSTRAASRTTRAAATTGGSAHAATATTSGATSAVTAMTDTAADAESVMTGAADTHGAAFAHVVLIYERQLHSRAQCICRNHDEARDLVQDTFVRAWRHYPQLRPGSNIRGWLMTIMVNLYRDAQRRKQRSREVAFEDWHDVAAPPQVSSHPALEPEQVDAAMARLPSALRGLLTMKAVEGLRYQDIGQRLGIPANTVGTRLRLARKLLSQLLGMTGGEDPRD